MTGLNKETERMLADTALAARERAYAPYSSFTVGAALLAASGAVYTGVNIENAAFSPANCAERTAFFKAVSEGERGFLAIAIAGAKAGAPALSFCAPCGVCRQVMLEFCDPKRFMVLLARSDGEIRKVPLDELTPFAFTPDQVLPKS